MNVDSSQHPSGNGATHTPHAVHDAARAKRDMSRVALFISLLGVLLLAVFFFALNQNIMGVADKAQNVDILQERLQETENQMAGMQQRLVAAEKAQEKARHGALGLMAANIANQTAALHDALESEEQREKLRNAAALLQEVSVSLQQQH